MAQFKIKGLAPTTSGFNYKIKGPAIAENDNNGSDNNTAPSASDIPQDTQDFILNSAMGIANKATEIPGEVSDAAQAFYHHPFSAPPRAARGVLSGIAEAGKGAYNLPLQIATYLGSKNIPYFKQISPLAEKLKMGDTGLQKLVMGEEKEGDKLWQDIGTFLPIVRAPGIPPISSRGIVNQISRHKTQHLNEARHNYNELFEDATNRGVSHVIPNVAIGRLANEIERNSAGKFHNSLVAFRENPTLRNAHHAQSELGALERHLQKIDDTQGLTPSQRNTLRNTQSARQRIRESMFNNNALGRHPDLANRYENLTNRYREEVVPYTRLKEISEFERGRMNHSTVLKKLKDDDQFSIELARRYPGLLLHGKTAKIIGSSLLGISGYEELKKLFR